MNSNPFIPTTPTLTQKTTTISALCPAIAPCTRYPFQIRNDNQANFSKLIPDNVILFTIEQYSIRKHRIRYTNDMEYTRRCRRIRTKLS